MVPLSEGCYNNGQVYDPMPGGVQIFGRDADVDGWRMGTSTYKVTSKASTNGMLMSGHLFDGQYCPAVELGDSTGYHGPNYLGEVIAYERNEDWAVTDNDAAASSIEFTNKIKPETSERYDIIGYASEKRVEELAQSDSEVVYKMGCGQGFDGGLVQDAHVEDNIAPCVDFSSEGIKASVLSALTDSGGPVFTLDDNSNACVVATLSSASGSSGDTNCEGNTIFTNTKGTASYQIAGQGWYPVTS